MDSLLKNSIKQINMEVTNLPKPKGFNPKFNEIGLLTGRVYARRIGE